MKERKQAVLRKIRIIRMIGKGESPKKADNATRIEMMLEEIDAVEKIITKSLN